VILVSSGAVGLGKKEILGNATLNLVEKQACAAVGQGLLMNEYYRLFNDTGQWSSGPNRANPADQ